MKMLCITGALIQEGLKLLFVEFLIKETMQFCLRLVYFKRGMKPFEY